MLGIKPSYWVPLSSVWVPFINMHNGRVNDVTYCYNLGFLDTNEVSSYLGKNGFLHTNKRHSRTMKTINLPKLARALLTLMEKISYVLKL